MKLFVAGLPSDFDDTDLREMFELYGEVASAKLIIDKVTRKSKGFGFIDMPDKMEALQTIEALDGAGIKGKKMSVKQAEEQTFNSNRSSSNNNNYNRDRGNNNRFNRRY